VKERFKDKHIVNILTGTINSAVKSCKHDQNEFFGKGMDQSALHWSAVIRQAVVQDFLEKEVENYGTLKLTPTGHSFLENPHEVLITEGVKAGKFRKTDPQFFYFTVTGAADRFYSSRLVLRHCYNQDDFDENMRDAYREHSIDLIMRGLLV
jgi:superfamily II DNA helicase RecQ